MKTIGYLGRIDELFGAPATTRSWKTILSLLRILKDSEHVQSRAKPPMPSNIDASEENNQSHIASANIATGLRVL